MRIIIPIDVYKFYNAHREREHGRNELYNALSIFFTKQKK